MADEQNTTPQGTGPVVAAPPQGEGSKVDLTAENQRLKAQLGQLTQAQQRVTAELTQLKQQGFDVTSMKADLAEIRSGIEAANTAQTALQISTLVAQGDEEGARAIAERDIRQRVNRLGIDLKTDPRLKNLREMEDPLEAHRALSVLEPVLRVNPVGVNPAPQDGNKPEAEEQMRERIRQEERAKLEEEGAHKIVTAPLSGGGSLESMSSSDLIKEGLRKRDQ